MGVIAEPWEDAASPTLERASPSSLKLLAHCPKAYAFRHVGRDRAPAGPPAAAMLVGSLAHLALERGARSVMAGRAAEWHPDGLAELLTPADGQDAPPEAVADARSALRTYAPRFDASAAVAVEVPFELKVAGVRVRGRIDRVDVHRDVDVRVIDYKTGYPTAEKEGYEQDPQTLLYGLAARDRFPFAERVTVEYHFLRAGFRFSFRQGAKEAAEAEDLVERAADAYARAVAPGSSGWAPAVSGACARCDFRARCDAYQLALEQRTVGELVGESWTTEELIVARQECAALETIAEARKKELNALLLPRLAKAPGAKIAVPGWSARIASRDIVRYPEVRDVLAVLAEYSGASTLDVAAQVAEVSTKGVDRFVEEAIGGEDQKKAAAAVEGLALHQASTWVDVRKGKENP